MENYFHPLPRSQQLKLQESNWKKIQFSGNEVSKDYFSKHHYSDNEEEFPTPGFSLVISDLETVWVYFVDLNTLQRKFFDFNRSCEGWSRNDIETFLLFAFGENDNSSEYSKSSLGYALTENGSRFTLKYSCEFQSDLGVGTDLAVVGTVGFPLKFDFECERMENGSLFLKTHCIEVLLYSLNSFRRYQKEMERKNEELERTGLNDMINVPSMREVNERYLRGKFRSGGSIDGDEEISIELNQELIDMYSSKLKKQREAKNRENTIEEAKRKKIQSESSESGSESGNESDVEHPSTPYVPEEHERKRKRDLENDFKRKRKRRKFNKKPNNFFGSFK